MDEVGPILNPINAEGQLQGGMMMGIGMAIMEEIKLEDGRVTTVGLHDYKVPTIADVPPLRTDYITHGMGSGPFGAKGVGELGIVGIAPRSPTPSTTRPASASPICPLRRRIFTSGCTTRNDREG